MDENNSPRAQPQPGHQASTTSRFDVALAGSSEGAVAVVDVHSLVSLPPELLDAILSHLSPFDLLAASETCHALRTHAISDVQWHRKVQANVPGVTLVSPAPFATYRELYAAHDPRWFLPRYKIWFCDRRLMGSMIIVRYDPRRGCIEGYRLLAVSHAVDHQPWLADSSVVVHDFDPRVNLHLDRPIIQFHATNPPQQNHGATRFAAEVPMTLDNRSDHISSNFFLTCALPDYLADRKAAISYPYDGLWPPPAVPASQRTAGYLFVEDTPDIHRYFATPVSRGAVFQQAFRIRQWLSMAGAPARLPQAGASVQASVAAGFLPPNVIGGGAPPPAVHAAPGLHMGEEILTYATLDPALYEPTALKPWRGIWVGDYSGHGCEFLLIHQPDAPEDLDIDEHFGLVREPDESEDSWEKRLADARIYRGRLEAVKLTGDPNVPRGEVTFFANDLGPEGTVGIGVDEPFQGVRIVRSRGHVAAAGFVDDEFIESELLLVSSDKIAQHWLGIGHISYFHRVNIDEFLVP